MSAVFFTPSLVEDLDARSLVVEDEPRLVDLGALGADDLRLNREAMDELVVVADDAGVKILNQRRDVLLQRGEAAPFDEHAQEPGLELRGEQTARVVRRHADGNQLLLRLVRL